MKTKKKPVAAKRAALVVKTMPLSALKPHPRNPRVHPEPGTPAWDVLKASLAHDYFDSIVWNQRNGMLVSGHLRTKVLRESGFTSADCVVVDYDESTHIARMLAANKLQGEDDMAAIKDLLQEIDTGGMDMALTGFDEKQIENLMTQFHVEDGRDGDKAGASPWDRVAATSDGVIFSFGDIQCRIALDIYDKFSKKCPETEIPAWVAGVISDACKNH